MKSIVRSLLFGLLALCALAARAGEPQMADPLLGLSFDPRLVHFDALPRSAAVYRALGPTAQWVFASRREAGGAVYIVAGLHTVQADEQGPAVSEPDFGAVIRAYGKQLKVLGVPDRLFDPTPLLPADELDALMRDAAQRYVRAFGGTRRLEAEMARQRVVTHKIPQPLRDALAREGVRPGDGLKAIPAQPERARAQ
ncbi:hypothetical protein ABWL39_19465 [Chitinivorax sp. PXF-14]|uniref:hypothetical protein n=1 Tax=Chitinivorax sp. PXF-14 TaxID=3230488 RepID=UPI003466DD3A